MPYLGFSAKNDITINATSDLELTSDNTTIKFGADDDVTITHDPDDGLIFKSIATADDNPFLLTIQTGETDLAANDVIGKIQFQAPDEGTGTDANLVSAAIQAVAEGDFSSSSNATSLQFMTGSSEAAATKMTIDSSGNVGIGTTTIGDKVVVQGTASATASIVIQDPTANDYGTHLSYDDANSKAIFGGLTNGTKNPALRVARDAASGIEIDSSGNLMVGKTSVGYATDGFEARATGYASVSDTSSTPFLINLNGNDGDLIDFYKAGAAVGSIGKNSGGLYIGYNDAGLTFEPTLDAIIPTNASTGSYTDNTLDIGYSTKRFNDLYLGGGVYVGGTGSANYLDDYEEGTWTPSVSQGTLSGTSPSLSGRYIKIGDFVSIKLTITNSAGDLEVGSYVGISGVPFSFSESAQGVVLTEDIDVFARQGFASCSGTNIFLSACGSSSGTTALLATVSGRI
jgi:hypothetical protein